MKQKKTEIWCHYYGKWLPKGRARTKCPGCGAVLGKYGAHKTRVVK